MFTVNSVLKPPILTLPDHNYTKAHVSAAVNNGKHSMLEDSSTTPPSKRFVSEQSNFDDTNTMELGNTDADEQSNDDFLLVGNRKSKSSTNRSQLTNQRYKTSIQNRFDPISTQNDNNDTSVSAATKSQRIPPIFLHDANDHQALIKDLNSILKHNYFTENKGNSVKINVSTSDDFRVLTAHFDAINVQYHSFCPPDNKRLSVIMRNVPVSLTDEEISTELKSNNYPVVKVTRLYNKNKYPMPLCALELEDSDSGNEIFGLEFLFHCKIQIELKRKSKTIPQCTRCQRFGHTKNYCRLEPRCVKCTGNHLYTECPKKKEDPVQCVNCSDSHTANYRGCPYYLNLKSKTSKNTRPLENTKQSNSFDPTSCTFPVLKPKHPDNLPRSQNDSQATQRVSYASAANSATSKLSEVNNNNTSAEPPDTGSLNPLFDSLLTLIKPYIPQIKSFISELLSSIFKNGF